MTDEVIREVRRVRHEISLRCDHDPLKVVGYYREFQDQLKRSGTYRFCDKIPQAVEPETRQSDLNGADGR